MSKNTTLNIYLNNIKSILNEDIKAIDEIIDTINNELGRANLNSVYISNQTSETQKRLEEIKKEIKETPLTFENQLKIRMLVNEQLDVEKELKKQDELTDNDGDTKTKEEQLKLQFSQFKLCCAQLIETIDLHLEFPEENQITKEEIQNDLNKLNDQFKKLDFESLNNTMPFLTDEDVFKKFKQLFNKSDK